MLIRTRALVVAALAAPLIAGCAIAPNPLTSTELSENAQTVAAQVTADQEPVHGAIDLYEAMARALKYNLDHRVELMQAAVRVRELDVAHFALLPNAVAGSGWASRDNYLASSSTNIFTGQQSLVTSTSSDRSIGTADVTFSWNVLDFGLSYIKARQAADQFLVAEEARRKVVHRIVEDVRTAYWRAISADRLLKKLQSLEARVRRAQANSRSLSDERQTSPITAVTYERELVEIKRNIQELERELVTARLQLSTLMNLKPGTSFSLVSPQRSSVDLKLNMPVADMIGTALQNRAELRDVWYKARINQHDLDAALLELLPGFQLYAGSNFDSNEFLYNNHWLGWGAKASWNLIRVFQYPAKRELIETQEALLKERALAVGMAVMTQVHVSRVRFYHFAKELKTANEYLSVQRRLVELMRHEATADRISEQTLIREEMNTLVAEVKRDIAYANLQNAFGSVYSSMGLDPYAANIDPRDESLKQLAGEIRGLWIERGDFAAAKQRPVKQAMNTK